MVYKFDPTYSTATIFDLDDSTRMMEKGWMEFVRENKPIPASYFSKSLTIERAKRFLCFTPAEASSWCRSGRVQSSTDWPPARSGSFRSPFERRPTTWLNPLLDALYSVRDFARMIMATLGARIPFFPVGLEAQPRITLRLSLTKACYL